MIKILGINAYHPDSSVALLEDGKVIWAAEEERFNRIKHASGFPAEAVRQCLKQTGTSVQDIQAVAISKNPRANLFKKILYTLKTRPNPTLITNRLSALNKSSKFSDDFYSAVGTSGSNQKLSFIHVEHHKAHIASSFFVSGYDESAFLSIDGMGDFSSAMWGMGRGTQLQVMDRIYFPHSVGFLYTACTQFLGFHHYGDEYKVMGLAAYGKPEYLNIFRKMIRFLPKGRFELNLDYFLQHKGQAKVRWEGGAPTQDLIYSEKWADEFGKPRDSEQSIGDHEKNIAASLQAVLEEVLFHVLNHLYETTRSENLCMAGGVALNGVANGKITKNTPFKNVYIQAASNDSGTAIGAAAYVYHSIYNQPRTYVMENALLGPEETSDVIEREIKARNLNYRKLTPDELIETTVNALAQSKVVGWFQGKMEFGPRALGNRSILADPRNPEMRDILNQRIKNRENFRPFAPVVPTEHAHEYFDMDCQESPFMLKVFPVKPDKKGVLSATTHVDGTARVQTVSRHGHPLFWQLLLGFGAKTGVPILLNTSFNENEPIVCSASDAIECFLKTKMDVLVIGEYYLERK